MVDTNVGTGLPPQLVKHWTVGPGGAIIRWGVDGDFDRCKLEVNKAIVNGGGKPLSDRVISGLCSDLHVIATGARPGHAPTETSGK